VRGTQRVYSLRAAQLPRPATVIISKAGGSRPVATKANGEDITHRRTFSVARAFIIQISPIIIPSMLFDRESRNLYYRGMKTTVSEKGQVTIPKPLRHRLGIRTGQVLEVKEERGRLVVTKLETTDPVEEVYGILNLGGSTDSILRALRGERTPK